MPGCCAVDGCTNWDRVKDTLFHRFPKKEEVRKAWIDSCGKKKVNADHARICSNHFKKTDYERNLKYEILGIPVPRSRRTLRKDAVPSKHIPKVKEESRLSAESPSHEKIDSKSKEFVHQDSDGFDESNDETPFEFIEVKDEPLDDWGDSDDFSGHVNPLEIKEESW